MKAFAKVAILSVGVVALALLAGAANAAVTVFCVPSKTIDGTCVTAEPTIQAAVTAAAPGDVILVGKGTYPETVTITTPFISIFGAQAGVDARTGRTNPLNESTLKAGGGGLVGFEVETIAVVIDGFTIQGATLGAINGCGIDLKGGASPADFAMIFDNIIQGNAEGLCLNFEGFAPVTEVVIQRNNFRNNLDKTDHISDGIFTSACESVIISDNSFSGHLTADIGINNSLFVDVSNNQSTKSATFGIFTGTDESEFSHNVGTNFVAGTSAFGAGDAAVAIGPGNFDLAIRNNTLTTGAANGIAFTNVFGPGPNVFDTVGWNTISGFALNGFTAENDVGTTPSLVDSSVVGNSSGGNKGTGFFVDTANVGNLFAENKALTNAGFGCDDDSSGSGTAGTANIWTRNHDTTSDPSAICPAK